MRVREIMAQPVQTCTANATLGSASRRMRVTGCGTLAVLTAGRVVGILTDRDLALALGHAAEPAGLKIAEVMTRRVHTCRPDDDVQAALETMAQFKVRRLPVVSATGELEGLISIDDIILWGVPKEAVSHEGLVDALRAICSASWTAAQETTDS